ncbi:unnamed protein product, partial [Rotaria magnacalcarata]
MSAICFNIAREFVFFSLGENKIGGGDGNLILVSSNGSINGFLRDDINFGDTILVEGCLSLRCL